LKKTSSKTNRGANTNPVQMNLSLGNFDAAIPPAIAPKAAATAAAAALRKLMDASVRGSRRFGCWLSTACLLRADRSVANTPDALVVDDPVPEYDAIHDLRPQPRQIESVDRGHGVLHSEL
jgi:hypothetical protein